MKIYLIASKTCRSVLLIGALLFSLNTVAAQDDIALDENYTSQDDSFSFDHPEDWTVAEQNGLIALLTDADMLGTNAFESGTAGAFIYPPYITNALAPSNAAPAETLDAILEQFSQSEDVTALDDPAELEINDGIAKRQDYRSQSGDSSVIAIQMPENNYAAMVIGTAEDELADFLPPYLAVAETFAYAPTNRIQPTPVRPTEGEALPLGDPYLSPLMRISFRYPINWQPQETSSTVIINNQSETIASDGGYLPGAVQVVIFPPIPEDVYEEVIGLDASATPAELLEKYTTEQIPSDDNTEFETVETARINGRDTASQIIRADLGDVIYYLTKEDDDSIMIMALGTSSGDLDSYLPTARAMIRTLERVGE